MTENEVLIINVFNNDIILKFFSLNNKICLFIFFKVFILMFHVFKKMFNSSFKKRLCTYLTLKNV